MAALTETQRAFVRDNPFCAVVTTLRADGSPHSTVIWVDEQDGKIVFNTTETRAKGRQLERDPRASVAVVDPADAYRWLSVSGPVELTRVGANEMINHLSQKYDGHDFRPLEEGERRVTAVLTPERIDSAGL